MDIVTEGMLEIVNSAFSSAVSLALKQHRDI